MEQVFRIEIPVEAIDKTDAAALQRLEAAIQKLLTGMKENKTAADGTFDAIERGASSAKTAMQQVESATDNTASSYDNAASKATSAGSSQEQAASGAATAAEKLETSVSEVSDAYDDTASAASEAGQQSGSAFSQASGSADQFTQRVEKSNQTLRGMFKEKIQLMMEALDRASPILNNIWNTAKSVAGKAWNIAVKMKDFITAPFRKLYSWITSPITIALSIAGIGLSAKDFLNTYTEFETGMSAVKATAGATDEEFLLLKQTAKDLGATTAFSASQAAEGMENLASAGFTASEIISAMPGMLDLAAASGEDLANASEIAATTLRGFGLEAEKAGHVADVLAELAARTNAAVSDTGEAMKYIAPVANAMGLSLEEVAASIGLLSDVGIKGSQAGTTLRSALTRLASPTKDMLEVMDSLNLSFYDSNGQMKSIASIVGMLNTEMAGLTDAEKQNALTTLFGQSALSGMLALMEAGPEKIKELTESLEDCEGAAAKMAEVRLDNLAGDLEAMGGAIETAQLELMEKLNPYLRSAVQWLTDKIPGVQTLLENAIDTGIEKAKSLYEHVKGVFDSDEFQNADGFVDKFFVAWDKIIAEPFNEWWSGGGKEDMLGKLADFGEGAGELLHGVIAGIFAAIKGEDIDFEGLNITGLAAAGADAAKTFVSSFIGGFDIGGLFGKMPGLMQAGLVGFGAIKVGSGIAGTVKTFSALKTALLGTGAAAASATPAVAAVGQGAAVSAIGIGKAGIVLGGLKTALAAIPVWGWVAAAAITAAAIGIKLYTDAQERQRQELLHFNEAGAEAAEIAKESAKQYVEFADALDNYKQTQFELETLFKPISDADKQSISDTITSLSDKKIEIETILANGGLSESERSKLTAQLVELESNEIALKFTIQAPSQEDLGTITQQISAIEEQQIKIQALIDGGGLPASEVAALKAQISDLETSKIALEASLGPLSATEIKTLTDKLAEIEAEKVEIEALIADGGLPPEQISALEGQIDALNSQEILIKATLSNLSDEEVAQYTAERLGVDYAQLIESSGGRITQADVDAGRVTQEVLDQTEFQIKMQAETDLINFGTEVRSGAATVPTAVEARSKYGAEAEQQAQYASSLLDDKLYMSELDTQRKNLIAQYNAGTINDEQLMQGGVDIIGAIESRFGEFGIMNTNALTPDMLFGEYTGGLFGSGLFGHWEAMDTNPFQGTFDYLDEKIATADERNATAQGDYSTQNAALVGQYQNEKALLEQQTFFGSQLAGMSLEEVAASYATLDDVGRQLFDDAVMALNTLNAETDYISNDEKTSAVDVVDIAAKAEVMQNVQTQVQSIAENYQQMTVDQQASFAASEEGAAQLAAVNEALSSLGLDQIESLDQLNSALDSLSGVDLSGFTLEAVQSAFTAVGGDATASKSQVDALRDSINAMDGMTTSSTHTHTNIVINKTRSISLSSGSGYGPTIAMNATGGIYDGALLSWVAEDGPEAIIPLGSDKRGRGLELWMQAGEMMGVAEFADGGIVAPYAGVLSNSSNDVWDEDDESPKPVHVQTGNGDGVGRTIEVSIVANPTFHIEGGDGDDIIEKIKSKQKELAEILGGAFAEQLEDIISNMV